MVEVLYDSVDLRVYRGRFVAVVYSIVHELFSHCSTLQIRYKDKMAKVGATLFAVMLLFVILSAMTIEVAEGGQVSACGEVCNRIESERDSCCRAHGHSSYSHCSGGSMFCH